VLSYKKTWKKLAKLNFKQSSWLGRRKFGSQERQAKQRHPQREHEAAEVVTQSAFNCSARKTHQTLPITTRITNIPDKIHRYLE
jgi:hypothetical protein